MKDGADPEVYRALDRQYPLLGNINLRAFDVNADVVQNIIDGKILFAIDQQPYVQGYLGVTGIYLKALNGNDVEAIRNSVEQLLNANHEFTTKLNQQAAADESAGGAGFPPPPGGATST